MPLNVVSIGGSRNIGYFSSIRFLNAGCTVTFLLRSPSIFDSDEVIQKHLESGNARLLQGDALVRKDVQRAWEEAAKYGKVDLLLFTVGGTPSFSLRKGAIIKPANLVTQSFFNVLRTMPKTDPQPRIIAISSTGVTHTSNAALPLLLRPMYGYLLAEPHKDKMGLERLVSYCAGWPWDVKEDGEPGEDIMGSQNWMNDPELPAAGSLKKVLVIRPAFLTDGECKADKVEDSKSGYRVSATDFSGWTVSRKDVAHFVVQAAFTRWMEFENRCVTVAY